MRTATRFGYGALLSIFAIIFSISCSSNSSNRYSIEGSVTPSEAGSVTPITGEYDEGTDIEVRAAANDTWIFSSWEGDISGTENPIVVTVESDMVFTAVFEKLQYPLEITIDGGGRVEEDVIQSKKTDYEIGTEVELNAVADEGWVFVEWRDDLSGNENPQTLAMDEAKSVTAVFERKDYPLTVTTEGEGNVTEEIVEEPAKDYQYETVVKVTANPAEGWQFARWEGDIEGTENPAEITIDGEKKVTAVFGRGEYELTVEITGQGSVDQQLVDEASKTSYPYQSIIELTSNPESGWRFVRWEGDLDGNENPKEITMDGDKTVTAVFADNSFDLDVTIDGEGSVSQEVTGKAKTYEKNTIVELTAEPDAGWKFEHWEGDLDGDDNPIEITIDGNKSVAAIFTEAQYDVDLATEGNGSINIEPSKDSYSYGDEIEITADPDELAVFKEWGGDLSGDNNPETVTVTGDMNIIAIFGGRAEVETNEWSDMRITSVFIDGTVHDDGGLEVTERGVCWSTGDEFPNTTDDCASDGEGLGSFTSKLTGLTQGSTYYARAYAINKAGTAFGETVELVAGYVSHGFLDGVTPSGDSQFEERSYRLVESQWKGGVDKIWIERNLGSTGAVKNEVDSDDGRAGWFFQFNKRQGYYHDGSSRIPGGGWPIGEEKNSDWDIENDPCRMAFGSKWHIPGSDEWADFLSAPKSDDGMAHGNLSDAFDSLLRIHGAGVITTSGNLNGRGSSVIYWSNEEADSENGEMIWITNSDSVMDVGAKSGGAPLRCVKD